MRDRSPGHCSTKRPRDGAPRALPCSPYIAPLGAPPRSSLVSPLRWPVCAAAAEVALRFSLRLARAHRASRLVTKSQKVTGGRRGGGGGVVTGRHPVAFSLRAARKIPQILMITIPGADSRTRPRARCSPPPAPTFSTATRARSCARSSNTMSPTCARARALAGRPTRAQSHSQDRRRETPTHRAHMPAPCRRHETKERKRSARPRFFGARSASTRGQNEPWPAHARKTKTQRAASERKT